MILFRVLRYKNIMSTGNVFTEIRLDTHSTTLVIGENGAGKSTFLDALTFVLFGKPFRKINKPQLVNSITRKNCLVEIEFSIGTNEFKIIRGIKPNVFEIYQNDALINQDADNKDYQEHLEKHILKVNFKSFCQVVVLGSASFVPFMQLPTGQRREITEDLLDLQVFSDMNIINKNKLGLTESAITTKQLEIRLAKEKAELIKQHLAEQMSNDSIIIDEKNDIIKDTFVLIDEAQKEKNEIAGQIAELKAELKARDPLKTKLSKLSNLRLEFNAKVSALNENIEFLRRNPECPTCSQAIDEEFKKDHISKHVGTISSINETIAQLQEKIEAVKANIDEYTAVETKILNYEVRDTSLSHSIRTWLDYTNSLKKEITKIKSKVKSSTSVQLGDINKEIESLNTKLEQLYEDQEIYTAASMLLKDGGIKSRIIRQYIPRINKLINKYLSALDFFVDFQLNENFEETIKSRFRDEFTYASFSEGEKMRLNLAVLFTWRAVAKLRNSINTNILIMDEVMDSSLDNNGSDEFMKLITNMIKDTNTFIISHKSDSMIDKFDHAIKFVKVKNFSKMVAAQ
jgi:DNA repair exonuclease SbcCD ATPase subunit